MLFQKFIYIPGLYLMKYVRISQKLMIRSKDKIKVRSSLTQALIFDSYSVKFRDLDILVTYLRNKIKSNTAVFLKNHFEFFILT